MKKHLTTLALLSGLAWADSVTYEQTEFRSGDMVYHGPGVVAAIRFDEPVVPDSVVDESVIRDDAEYPGTDIFEVTGDDAHRPVLRWRTQDLLFISFPNGTSCATEYKLRFLPEHAKYLGGKPMPQAEFTFHCPPAELEGWAVPGMQKGAMVVTHPMRETFYSKEALEFSPSDPVTFTYRRVLETDEYQNPVRYGETMPAKVSPACVKHLSHKVQMTLLKQSKPDWNALTPESPIPGAVLVEPATPLPADTEWELLNSAGPAVKEGVLRHVYPGGAEVCIQPLYDPDSADLWVDVIFPGPVTEEAALRALHGLRVFAEGREAAVSEDARVRTLTVGGAECRLSFHSLLHPEKETDRGAKMERGYIQLPGKEEGDPVAYVAPGQVNGFRLKVEGCTPMVLDFAVPAGITTALGGLETTGQVQKVSINPAFPRIGTPESPVCGEYATWSPLGRWHSFQMPVLPLKGDHKLTIHSANEEALDVTAYRLPAGWVVSHVCELQDIFRSRRYRHDYAESLVSHAMAAARAEDAEEKAQLQGIVAETRREALIQREGKVCEQLQAVSARRVAVPEGAGSNAAVASTVVDMDEILGGGVEPGIYLLRITPRASAAVRRTLEDVGQPADLLDLPRYAFVQITDIHLSASWPEENPTGLMATHLSDGSPVEGGVTAFNVPQDRDARPERVGGTVELSHGCADVAGLRYGDGALVYLVESGEDYAAIITDTRYNRDPAERVRAASDCRVVIQTDREYYRPGETVHVRAILRRLGRDGKASLPEAQEVVLRVQDPRDKDVVERTVPLDASGGIDEAFTLPEGEDATGWYTIGVSTADGSFSHTRSVQVQVFRRDSFKVEAALEVEEVAPEGFTCHIQAQDFNGTPVSGGKAELEIQSPVPLQTLQGAPCRSEEDSMPGCHTYKLEVPLDAAGAVHVTGRFTPLGPKDRGSLFVEGGVANDRAEYVSMKGLVSLLEPADFRPSFDAKGRIKLYRLTADGWKELDRAQSVHVVLHATVEEEVRMPNGFVYERGKDVVLQEEDITIPAGCTEGVLYTGKLESHSGKARTLGVAISGADPQGHCVERVFRWFDDTDGYKGVKADYEWGGACRLGEDGKLHFKDKIRHTGTAIWSLSHSGRLRTGVLPVQAGQEEVLLPLEDGVEGCVQVAFTIPYPDAAGVYVNAEYHRDTIRIPARKYTLQTRLDVPEGVVRPGSTVGIGGQVGRGGKGVPATVTLFAVDAGMLSLSDFTVEDLAEAFVRPAQEVPYGFVPNSLMLVRAHFPDFPELKMINGLYTTGQPYENIFSGNSGSWGVYRGSMLADVDSGYTVHGSGKGAAGGARLRTDFRPVALWCGTLKTDAAGRFHTDVNLPDTLTTYKLFALVVGDDACTFGNAEAEFTVDQPLMLTPGTPLFMSVGDTLRLPVSVTNNTDAEGTWTVRLNTAAEPQQVTVPARGSATLYFDFTAGQEGGAVLEWTAEGGAAGDAVQGCFPIRFPAPVLKEAHRLVLSEGQGVKPADLLAPELAESTRGEVEIRLSADPLSQLEGCVDYLLTYPYGCTEQTASALLPWLLHDRLAPLSRALSDVPAGKVREVVARAVADLLQRQKEDGGLGYWWDSLESCGWASAHAAVVLKIATERGYGDCIPAEKMEKLFSYLRAFSAQLEEREDADPQTLFSLAYVLGEEPAVPDARNADLAFIHALRRDPSAKHEALLRWMRARGHDTFHTTRSSAWALIALHEYLRLTPAATQEAVVRLQDGTALGVGQGVTVLRQQAVPLSALPDVLTVERGEVYVTLKAKALPNRTDYPGVVEKGLQVTRIYDKKGADGVWREAAEFSVGDVVRVTLTCAKIAPELQYFVLEDYLPASMEAINPAIPSQAAGLEQVPWSQCFDHKEYLADRVRGFCTRWHGSSTLNMTYYARVKRAGTCTAPPAQAQLMYEPQTYGLSPNTTIQTK